MFDIDVIFNDELIKRYEGVAPRYTSYPSAAQFAPVSLHDYQQQAALTLPHNPLSLYIHIPFCDMLCYYCGCNKIVTKDRSHAQAYLLRLYKEMRLQNDLFDEDRPITQLHWGGGTPTFINNEQMCELMHVTREYFNLLKDDQGEYSIEIDPRRASPDTLHTLRQIGFNRLSFGVQDFNPIVQKAVHRIQCEEETADLINASRALGFKSISLDLIYGLPFQSVASFAQTIDKIIALSPDRLSLFNYAHMPHLFPAQRRINEADLPTSNEKIAIFKMAIESLTQAGYVYIGMDHFAKPDNELALAQQNRTLHRNFQGYSTQADCDLIGFGVSSIGKINNSYMQNVKTLDQYYAHLDAGELAIEKGVVLTNEDRLRRHIINELICYFELDINHANAVFNIDFNAHFKHELTLLKKMVVDVLVLLSDDKIIVTATGKLLIRHICKVFDQYSRLQATQRFSKVI